MAFSDVICCLYRKCSEYYKLPPRILLGKIEACTKEARPTLALSHCISAMGLLSEKENGSNLLETYLMEWISTHGHILAIEEQTLLTKFLQRMKKNKYIVVDEEMLCSKDQVLFSLVTELKRFRIGIIERALSVVSIVFDIRTAGIVAPQRLSENW